MRRACAARVWAQLALYGMLWSGCAAEPDPEAAAAAAAARAPAHAEISLDAGVTYQTIAGWEAHAQSGQSDVPQFATYADRLLDTVAYDLGINRVRLPLWSGSENPVDYYAQLRAGTLTYESFSCPRWETINDNADPTVIDPAGFHFTQLDELAEHVIVPLRQKLDRRGEQLYVNLTYAAFLPYCTKRPYVHEDPAEYAELILAAFVHLRDRYGIVPDGVNVILEPDNTEFWTGQRIGKAIVATAAALAAHGFHPEFIAPSISHVGRAARFIDAMLAVPAVTEHLTELSYHRYGRNSAENLRAVRERAERAGVRTAMLEKTAGDYEDLHEDLKLANVSAWQQFAIALRRDGRGGNVLVGVDPDTVPVRIFYAARTHFLRQYFKFIRRGAVRIGAASSSARFDPLAFVNVGGGHVVVVKAAAAGSMTVTGLPPGRYGVMYTTDAEAGVELPPVQVAGEGMLSATIPARGVLTIYAN